MIETKSKYESVEIGSLTVDPDNARAHSERNIEAIKKSLDTFGQQKPIVVDAEGKIVAGNGTLEAAKSLGWTSIDIVRTELTGAAAIAFAVADNRTAELAEWDEGALAKALAGLKDDDEIDALVTGFDQSEIDQLVGKLVHFGEETDEQIPALPENPITKAGDLIVMGEHRLVCGDCRSSIDVNLLMAGVKINVAVTSPPYASQRKYDETTAFKPIPPDEYVDWFEAVQVEVAAHLADDGSWFINIKEHCEDGERSLYVKDLTLAHARKWGWRFVDEYAWTHGGTPKAVVNRFKNGWEPIFQFTRGLHKFTPDNVRHATEAAVDWDGCNPSQNEGQGLRPRLGFKENGQIGKSGHPSDEKKQGGNYKKGEGVGGRQGICDAIGARAAGAVVEGLAYPSNSLSLGKNREALGHGAAYPVSLPEFFIKAYSDKGDAIYDPFMGSGTTLIAAHQNERVGYGLEISPAYCDVIVKRWENLTGKEATR